MIIIKATCVHRSVFIVPLITSFPPTRLQEVVPRGVPCRADPRDDGEGRRGPHPAPHRPLHTPVQGPGGRLRSHLRPGAQRALVRAPRGAADESEERTDGRAYAEQNPRQDVNNSPSEGEAKAQAR